MDSGGDNFPDIIPPTKIAYISGRPATLHLRKCKLVMERSDGTPLEYIFDQPTVSIGAMDDNDVVVDDDTVSRYHCRVFQEEDAYLIQDLTSTNGTFVNRVRIREAYLKPGCTITAGKTDLRFQSLDERVEIQPVNRDRLGSIVGKSLRMREIFGILEKIAPTGVTVIIEGETGTGKEVVARTIHEASHRDKKPFVVFDCGAVPENLIESELFGHEKGSFTGAIMARQGLFEIAQGGTIFLDELGELSLDLQPKLLRALEQREIRRVGSNKPIKIDVRVIAATNRNLAEEVKAGRFREDLFYRLSVVRLILPPLRERKEDLPLLARHILSRGNFNKDTEGLTRVKGVAREALDAMMNYHWPGNVRELVNVVERACAYTDSEYVTLEDLPEQISGIGIVRRRPSPEALTSRDKIEKASEKPFKEAKEEWVSSFERDYIVNLLKRNSFNISHAAREADIDRKYFRKLMKKYGIEAADGDDD
ncbi:MAG: Fis family transcriptional regulator [Deltaproteobacteria bacterium HGW-Deltaproteobacteria-14]|jgi:transcriptional regulator with GAF, ATPase, and Fis domain|nr:MAG: Fis family transcriptional regulator [Deltaproteobacteria bacterium HGW-Deltaproteobacteria-14]